MSDILERSLDEEARERVRPIVSWLLEERLNIGRTERLFTRYCERLREVGLPLDRATIHLPQLHPQLFARSLLWLRETGGAVETGHRHGDRSDAFYLRSPVRVIYEGGASVYRRIERRSGHQEFPILDDLLREGFVEYFMLPIVFGTGRINAISFATKEPRGFDELDRASLAATLPAFGTVLELIQTQRTARSLLDTYVGRGSGERILNGAVRRGQGEEIHAVVWYCDLRGFTSLSQSEELAPVIALLNEYFDCMAAPVEAQGGEILKFMGDSILAIFPCESTWDAKCDAANRAIVAAEEALVRIEEMNLQRAARGAVPLRVGIAIGVGKVMYGNIGAADRLDFTVIGPVVNLVSRLEPLTVGLDPPIVVSESLARISGRRFRELGRFALKGISEDQPAFTPESESAESAPSHSLRAESSAPGPV
jgi:adenylate cyclase